ncbi:MAG: cold shock domain-containing protein [Elusimicrobia bacterium]|nr:cold shock domain-containing protein [Elusimicrobiota bacterium]
MNKKLFLAPLFAAALAAPASAQRALTRVAAGQTALPVAAPSGLGALLFTAPALSLSAPSLAPGFAAPVLAPAAVQTPEPARLRGTVARWNEVRGYGFITPNGGGEAVYTTAEDIDQRSPDLKILKEGEEVEYELRKTPQGTAAGKVIPVRLLPAASYASADYGSGRMFDGSGPMRRPLVEGWRVAGRDYASTRELVLQLPVSPAPLEATYRFAHTDKPPSPARGANTVVGLVSGATIGSVFGMAFYIFGSIVNEVFGGRGLAPGDLGLFAGFFGAAGALMGALIGRIESRNPIAERHSISGRIYRHAGPQGETLYFAAKRDGGDILVDLGAYFSAKPIVEPAAPAPWPLWKRAAAGLAAGATLAVSQWIPLLQIFTLPMAGMTVGFGVGRALTADTAVAGGWLGGSLGLLVPVAAFFSFAAVQSVGILMSLGIYVAALAAVGLVVGVFAANAVRAAAALEEARSPADQWWGGAKGGSNSSVQGAKS